jgi:hypothetical protein
MAAEGEEERPIMLLLPVQGVLVVVVRVVKVLLEPMALPILAAAAVVVVLMWVQIILQVKVDLG